MTEKITETTTIEIEGYDKNYFGFWLYILTDLLMFAVFFAAYAVLHNNTFGGEGSEKLFSLPLALTETLILLTSSFTCGIGMLYARLRDKQKTLLFFMMTFVLGIAFLGLELSEFSKLITEGNTPQRSGFLSAFFTLVGTHGVHILSGLFWLGILLIYIVRKGITECLAASLRGTV